MGEKVGKIRLFASDTESNVGYRGKRLMYLHCALLVYVMIGFHLCVVVTAVCCRFRFYFLHVHVTYILYRLELIIIAK